MARCLHRCVAAFTCQLLVEVVSWLMTHGADSDGSACLLSLPRCLFLRPRSSVPAQLKATSAQHGNEHCTETQLIPWNANESSAGFCHRSAVDSVAVSLIFIHYFTVTVKVTRLDLNIVTANMIFVLWKKEDRVKKDAPYWDGLGTFYVMLNNNSDVGLLYVSRVLTVSPASFFYPFSQCLLWVPFTETRLILTE